MDLDPEGILPPQDQLGGLVQREVGDDEVVLCQGVTPLPSDTVSAAAPAGGGVAVERGGASNVTAARRAAFSSEAAVLRLRGRREEGGGGGGRGREIERGRGRAEEERCGLRGGGEGGKDGRMRNIKFGMFDPTH